MDELRQATHGKQILISVGVTSNKCNLRMGKTLQYICGDIVMQQSSDHN